MPPSRGGPTPSASAVPTRGSSRAHSRGRERRRFTGTFAYGQGPTERIIIDSTNGLLGFTRMNGMKRGLTQRAPGAFSPAGAPGVRIKFVMQSGRAVRLTVHDPDLMLTANRV